MRRASVFAIVVGLVLAGCSDGDDEPAGGPPADRPSVTSTTTGAAAPPVTTGASLPATVPGGSGGLRLGPDGVGDLRFGAPEAQVRQALTQSLGAAESDDVLPPGSCSGGATRSLSWGALHVLLGPDGAGKSTLYGWTYGTDDPPGVPAAATPEAITVGSTRADLERAYGDRLEVREDEALGAVRFFVNVSSSEVGVSGILTGTAASDRVRGLFAGSYCGE